MAPMLGIWFAAVVGLCGMMVEVHSQGAEFWNDQAQNKLKEAIRSAENLNRKVAKNVVMFVGDGMGPSTVTAARILKGQLAGLNGEEAVLAWEDFPSFGLSKTYTTDRQTPDSAGTATAYFCGVKAKSGVIGVDDSMEYGVCSANIDTASVDSVMTHAARAGKATGFVTTARVTHATPSALYAHVPRRSWEADMLIPADQAGKGCIDIALQLITRANDTNVILAGGRVYLMPETDSDPEYPDKKGLRKDGRNLIEEWISGKDPDTSKYVWKLDDFNKVDTEQTDYLLGLFERSHMKYEFERADDTAGEPSISEMTEKAIKILQKDEKGFFLMVEGARIDHGHHDGKPYKALYETVAMDKAVAKAMEMTNEEDTLVIVTADHSHVFTMGGNPSRGNPILGLDDSGYAVDGLPYPTLQYGNGPGAKQDQNSYGANGMRRNLTDADVQQPEFEAPCIFYTDSETHGGEDLAIYANGPMSHLFHGVHEQNYIAHVVRYAACLDYKEHCDTERVVPPISHYDPDDQGCPGSGGSSAVHLHEVLLIFTALFLPLWQI
ncbi:alkaline phosphatase-like [Patiria miniata]|uniref:alkaline phosphatase n=1 Tax=Patiria miniata TaxID=46514 RepID=A0A914BKF2_PATMI|nr:alkaline phosphatase-like [Patiria miniata]